MEDTWSCGFTLFTFSFTLDGMLYRKYRPKTFAEVQGQDHVVQTLRGALISGKVGHAYLFCGPRGTGKTTLARLLAKALTCANVAKISERNIDATLSIRQSFSEGGLVEPCNTCPSCIEINEGRSLDLIEIDAASHTGVDHVRELIDSARVAATTGGYKIFLIDEVHMLSKSAFNALLKTLEEPPAHTIFLLATTEPHKLPDTVLSRVQRFDLKKLTVEEIQKKLERVAKTEKISLEPDAVVMLARYANGSLRDAESALSKLIAFALPAGRQAATITARDASAILGVVPEAVHAQLLSALINKNAGDAFACIAKLHEDGVDLEHFTKQFVDYVRGRLIDAVQNKAAAPSFANDGAAASPRFLADVARSFMFARSQLKTTPIPPLPLELAITELTETI